MPRLISKQVTARLLFGVLLSIAVLVYQHTFTFWWTPPMGIFRGPTPGMDAALSVVALLIGFFLWPLMGCSQSTQLARALGNGALAGVVGMTGVFIVFALFFVVGGGIFALAKAGGSWEAIVLVPVWLAIFVLVGAAALLIPALPYGVVAGLLTALLAKHQDKHDGSTGI